MSAIGARAVRVPVPDRWREGGGEMLLPQGSILANWVLATMSSRGMASLAVPHPALPPSPQPPAAGRDSAARVGRLSRKLGGSDADHFFRALLEHHFAAGQR